MLRFIFSVIFLFSIFYSPNLWSSGNYNNCILKNLKEITSDVASQAIIDACVIKHKDKPNSICIETDAKITNDVIFLKTISKPFSGKNYCEYPNYVTKSKGDILNGKKNDKWMWWHKDGNLGLEINYIKGKKNGKLIKWHKFEDDLVESISLEGQMQLEENYKGDKKNGKSTMWYRNGQIQLEENYKDDKKNGKSTMWYKNGQMQLEENYKDDKKDGQSTTWQPNGQVYKGAIYKVGVCISGDC